MIRRRGGIHENKSACEARTKRSRSLRGGALANEAILPEISANEILTISVPFAFGDCRVILLALTAIKISSQ